MDTTAGSSRILKKNKPFRVIVCLITLAAFFVSTISYDLAWAVGTLSGSPGGGLIAEDGPGSVKELNPDTFTLPEYLGQIKDSYKGTSGKTVIHIQDAHCNYACQKGISEIINYINKEHEIDTINLEGGAGKYDISIFTRIKDRKIREKVSDYFVEEGLVNGAEYYAINNPDKSDLWGVEDVDLYLKNLNVYRDSLKHKDQIDKYLRELNHIINNLKRHIFNEELLEMSIKYDGYKEGNIEFKDYLNYLIEQAKTKLIDIKQYPNIYLINQSLEQEKSIDFRRADAERSYLIDDFEDTLSKMDFEKIIKKSVEFKTKTITQKEYYSYLFKKAEAYEMDLTQYPQLQKYLDYISTYEAVEKAQVMIEMNELENNLKETLFENNSQRKLDVLSKNLVLIGNLFNLKMSKEDWDYYCRHKKEFGIQNFTNFISQEAGKYKITAKPDGEIGRIDEWREKMEDFFTYSFARDEAFLNNLKTGGKNQLTILMTGGFHTENLLQLLENNDISYISILPQFRNPTGYESPYFNLLGGEFAGKNKNLPSAILEAYSMQIASALSALGQEVWDKANLDAIRAAVVLRKIAEERGWDIDFNNINKEGIFDKSGNKLMSIRTLMWEVHEMDIDTPIRQAFEARDRGESGKVETVSLNAREEAAKRLERIAESLDGEKREILENMVEGIRSGSIEIHLVDVGDADFIGHAGGRGMHINMKNRADVVNIIVHEAIAAIAGDHLAAEKAELGQVELAVNMLAEGEMHAPVWDMDQDERMEIDRDFAETKQEVLKFARDLEMKIEVSGRSSVEGDFVRRSSATVTLRSKNGREFKVVFIGTTHDWKQDFTEIEYYDDEGGVYIPSLNDETAVPTDAEKAFIERIRSQHSDIQNFLVEQGDITTMGYLTSWLLELSLEDDALGKEIRRHLDVDTNKSRGELAWMAKNEMESGSYVRNMDLATNTFALQFIIDNKGLEEALNYAFYSLLFKGLGDLDEELLVQIVHRWFEKNNISVPLESIREAYGAYQDKYDGYENYYDLSNDFRDDHMAEHVLSLEDNVIVVAHTNHIKGIIRRLASEIVSFEPGEVEIAEGKFKERKIESLWNNEGVKSSQNEFEVLTTPGTLKFEYVQKMIPLFERIKGLQGRDNVDPETQRILGVIVTQIKQSIKVSSDDISNVDFAKRFMTLLAIISDNKNVPGMGLIYSQLKFAIENISKGRVIDDLVGQEFDATRMEAAVVDGTGGSTVTGMVKPGLQAIRMRRQRVDGRFVETPVEYMAVYPKVIVGTPVAATQGQLKTPGRRSVFDATKIKASEKVNSENLSDGQVKDSLEFYEKMIKEENSNTSFGAALDVRRQQVLRNLHKAEEDGYIEVDWERGKIWLLPIPADHMPRTVNHYGRNFGQGVQVYGNSETNSPTYIKIPETIALTNYGGEDSATYYFDTATLTMERLVYIDPEAIARVGEDESVVVLGSENDYEYGRTFIVLGGVPGRALTRAEEKADNAGKIYGDIMFEKMELGFAEENGLTEEEIDGIRSRIRRLEEQFKLILGKAPAAITPPASPRTSIEVVVKDLSDTIQSKLITGQESFTESDYIEIVDVFSKKLVEVDGSTVGVKAIRELLSDIEKANISDQGKAVLQMAVRAVLVIRSLASQNKTSEDVVVQYEHLDAASEATKGMRENNRTLRKRGYANGDRNIVVSDDVNTFEAMLERANNALKSRGEDARAILLVPQGKQPENLTEILAANPRIRVKIIEEEGNYPDVMTKFGLGLELLDFGRDRERDPSAIPSSTLMGILASITDADLSDPEFIENILKADIALKITKINFESMQESMDAIEMVNVSL